MGSEVGDVTQQGNQWVRRRWIALTLVGAVLATLGAVLLLRSPVTWQDSRFQILSFKVSRGTNHTIFHGNQMEGRLRTSLRGLGVPVKGLARHGVPTQREAYAFMLQYRGDFPDRELSAPRAEVINAAGVAIPLRWNSGGYSPKDKVYLSVWVLDAALIPDGKLALLLKLKRTETRVAEIAIGDLKDD
jgi:hypothetical protein